MINKKKFKAAVIGCGNIGAKVGNYGKSVQPGTHAGAYISDKRTQLAALVESDKKRLSLLKKNFPGVKIYTDPNDMFAEIKPDIVSIATPTPSHRELVLMAAKYKCPAILCEKPIALKVSDAKAMISACKKSNSLLFINHMRHFDPILRKWSEKVNDDFLGKIYQGNAYYYNGLFNNATHLIDLLIMFLGKPIAVSAYYNQTTSNDKINLNVDGMIFFKNNIIITLQTLSRNYGFFGFRIFGERGMLDVTRAGYEVQYRKKIKHKSFKGYFELAEKIEKEGDLRSFMASAVGYAIDCLQGKKQPISIGEDGLAVVRVLESLKESASLKGKFVKINY